MIEASDIRDTPLYREVIKFYQSLYAPGRGIMTDASDLSVASDGRTAAFTGTVFHDFDNPPRTRIGMLSLESGQVSVFESSTGCERLPQFSPDGGYLAYLSDREEQGNFQLYVMDLHGGGSHSAPTIAGVIETLSWSADGSRLLALVAGFGADIAGVQGGATTIRQRNAQPAWFPEVDSGDAENLWRVAYVFDVSTKTFHRWSPPGINVWECAWVNTHEIVCIASNSHSEGSWYTSRLLVLNSSGAVREMYQPDDQLGLPVTCPSGRWIAVIEAVCSDRLLVCGEILLLSVANGSTRKLDLGSIDVTQIKWRDEDTLTFVGLRGLETVIGDFSINDSLLVERWASRECTLGTTYPTIELMPDGGVLAIGECYSIPPQIVRIDTGLLQVVHSFAASEAAGAPPTTMVEPLSWNGRDGMRIEGWLVKPAGRGPFPLVMDIHGGPVWSARNRWHGRLRGAQILADHGIASLYPNPRGSSGRGARFARLVKGDMGGEDAHDCLAGVDALVVNGIADPAKLGVTGISYGGYLSAWLVTQDNRFAAAVPISPVSNWYSQHRSSQIPSFDALFLDGQPALPNGLFFNRSPIMFANRVKTPVLQLAGALDKNTPPTQALEFHRSLLEVGVPSVLVTYPNAGHGVRRFPELIDATTRYVGWFLEHFSLEQENAR